MKSIVPACIFLACAGSIASPCRADFPSFALTPLGDFGASASGKSYSFPTGVNDSGQAIGQSDVYLSGILQDQDQSDFLWSQGQLTKLNLIDSSVDQINNAGQVIGTDVQIINGNGYEYGYLWTNGVQTIIPTIGSGPLPNALDNIMSKAVALNDAGQVAGQTTNYTLGNAPAILWQNNQPTIIAPGGAAAAGFQNATVTALNDSGVVAGYFQNQSGNYPFAWQQGVFTPITATQGYAVAVNSSGEVVGYSGGVAWTWLNGQFTALPPISVGASGVSSSIAWLVNNKGWVAGTGTMFNAAGTAIGDVGIVWHDGVAHPVPGIAHGSSIGNCMLTSINAAGQALGYSDNYDADGNNDGEIALFYDDGVTTYLGLTVPGASAQLSFGPEFLTDDGSVFLNFHLDNGNTVSVDQAYYWHEGDGMIPLDDLILGGLDHSYWDHLTAVTAVSDNGLWVAGTGLTTTGNTEAFLLELIPEPSSLALLAFGSATLWRRRRRLTSPGRSSAKLPDRTHSKNRSNKLPCRPPSRSPSQ